MTESLVGLCKDLGFYSKWETLGGFEKRSNML